MATYKMILVGNNGKEMDDFFVSFEDDFSIMSSSVRPKDLDRHISCFDPDIFLYIIGVNDTESSMLDVVTYIKQSTDGTIVFGIAGTAGNCDIFQKLSHNMAEFTITLPVDPAHFREEVIDKILGSERLGDEYTSMMADLARVRSDGRRKHVLVIDDSPIMLKLVKERLKDKYDVATAISGKVAYKFLENNNTDFVLLDYEMPEEDGPVVFKTLREMPKMKNVPIAFLTGVTDSEKVSEVLQLKPQGYVLKPIDKDKLFAIIEKYIGG